LGHSAVTRKAHRGGVTSADPKTDRGASHLPLLTFEAALRMAEQGCDLVERQVIEAAMNYWLPVVVRCLDDAASSSRIASEGEIKVQSEPRPSAARGATASCGDS
jgi:aspartokinase